MHHSPSFGKSSRKVMQIQALWLNFATSNIWPRFDPYANRPCSVLAPSECGNIVMSSHHISQTPFEIYEITNGRNFPVSASNHFLTPTEGWTPLKKQYKGPGYTHQALGPRSRDPMMLRWLFSLCFNYSVSILLLPCFFANSNPF